MADTNVNLAVCIQKTTDFGVSHIHNVCSGAITDVAWGSVDWMLCIGLIGFGVAMTAMMGGLAVAFIRDC